MKIILFLTKGCVWNKARKFFKPFFFPHGIHSKPCPWREIHSILHSIRSSKSSFNMEFSIYITIPGFYDSGQHAVPANANHTSYHISLCIPHLPSFIYWTQTIETSYFPYLGTNPKNSLSVPPLWSDLQHSSPLFINDLTMTLPTHPAS